MTTVDVNEQKQMAIHFLRSGYKPSEVAEKLNRSISWVYKWHTRFKEEGWAGLQSRSCAPKQHGKRLSKKVRQAVIQARSELEAEVASGIGLQYIGPEAILVRLGKKEIKPLPSVASIGRIIRAAGMTAQQKVKVEEVVKYPRLHPTQPHQLVQVDIVPHFLFGGASIACFNAIDVVSRYPTRHPSEQRCSEDAAKFLIQVWQEIGIPQYTQVDNEACFSGGFTHQAVLGKVLRLSLLVGTELVFSPVRHPASNGTVERFHQDYNLHVWKNTNLKGRIDVAIHSDTFFQKYRHSCHHKSLKGQNPYQVHHQQMPMRLATDFNLPKTKLPLTAGRVHFMRRVSAQGTISVLNLDWQVPNPNLDKGVWVTIVFTLQGATLHIYDAAPDVETRICLVSYPFPLKEKVKPKIIASDPAIETSITLPNEVSSGLKFVRKLIPSFIRNSIETVAHFIYTIY